jgi:hypothetical protein
MVSKDKARLCERALSPLNLTGGHKGLQLGRVLIRRGRQWLLSGQEQTSQIGAVSSAFDPLYGPAVRCKRLR